MRSVDRWQGERAEHKRLILRRFSRYAKHVGSMGAVNLGSDQRSGAGSNKIGGGYAPASRRCPFSGGEAAVLGNFSARSARIGSSSAAVAGLALQLGRIVRNQWVGRCRIEAVPSSASHGLGQGLGIAALLPRRRLMADLTNGRPRGADRCQAGGFPPFDRPRPAPGSRPAELEIHEPRPDRASCPCLRDGRGGKLFKATMGSGVREARAQKTRLAAGRNCESSLGVRGQLQPSGGRVERKIAGYAGEAAGVN